ncbi:hypothetical protein [Flavobacterium sp.]|uniref:hypothetical protein n=1 Tax=Flavobacterium sp. TaxID=239 RepID=UPI002616A593|nr:hypothetical protein [Flavobacterium sp.]MDD3003789.1 hypothetical protein [Flavobacterium sp.]
MTAENLIPFFKVLTLLEQQKFIKLAAVVNTHAKVTSAKKQKAILTEEEAIQFLIAKHFNKIRRYA